MSELTDARYLAELGFLEEIFHELGYPTNLIEKSKQVPYHTLVVKIEPDAKGRPMEMALTFYPVDEEDVPNSLLLQYYIQLPFNVDPQKMVETSVLLSLVNNKLVLGHFSLADNENKLQFRYVQALPNDTDITTKMISDVVVLVSFSPVLFSDVLENLANGQISLVEAQEKIEKKYQ